jgi:glutamate-1-semialdehyde 2,1-aminomutase
MNVISSASAVGARDPLSRGSLPEVIDATDVLPFNDTGAVEAEFSAHGGEIAAVILEPIPHNVGALLPRPGFLERIRELCTTHGAVLIFDEVITGFRHSLGGYQSIAGVMPDLTTLGKAMANGYPIGAVGGGRELMDEFSTTPGRPVFFAGTYNGHPAMAAAALATIEKLRREPVHEHVFRLGDMVRSGLRGALRATGVPHVVTGFGSVWVTYFMDGPAETYTDLLRNDERLFVGYRRELLRHGIFELPLNLKRNHLSYVHDDGDVEQVIAATEACVRAVASGLQDAPA